MLQSCLIFCDPVDCILLGFSVHGILQTRILEWVAMPSSRGFSRPRGQTHVSCVSCIIDGFFTHWATWEAPKLIYATKSQDSEPTTMYSLQDIRGGQELFQGTDNVLLFDLDEVTQVYQFVSRIFWSKLTYFFNDFNSNFKLALF